jgi:hypothetical protein
MSPAQDDVPDKILIIRECLEKRFYEVRPHNVQQEIFFFHDGQRDFQFGFYRPAMEDLPLERLRTFMETEVIPVIVQNPGMQTFLGTDGFSIRDKVST